MYEMISKVALAQLLNQFSAPMFALERTNLSAPFRFVHINDAMEQVAHCDRHEIIGTLLSKVLPVHDHKSIMRYFMHSIETGEVIRFRESFAFSGESSRWDVTLQPILLADGSNRIIATCIQEAAASYLPETPALDDIQYFSSIADFQLQNLISTFETCQAGDLFEGQSNQRIERLSGMCRAVQRAVADIKKSLRNAQYGHAIAPTPLQSHNVPHTHPMFSRCGTLKEIADVWA